MRLLLRDYKRLEMIQKKLVDKTATGDEMQEFLELMVKSGNELEMSNYTKNIGFDSMDEVKKHLNNKAENKNLIIGLAVIGGAVLLAWILTKK